MKTFVSLTSLLASPVLAHPGHGTDGGSHSLVHYLTDPLHVAVAVLAAAILAAALARARSRRVRS